MLSVQWHLQVSYAFNHLLVNYVYAADGVISFVIDLCIDPFTEGSPGMVEWLSWCCD